MLPEITNPLTSILKVSRRHQTLCEGTVSCDLGGVFYGDGRPLCCIVKVESVFLTDVIFSSC